MAMSGRTRDRVERGLITCSRVRNSTGSLRGEPGTHRGQLGWLSGIPERHQLNELLHAAVYVVWSYDTPIGFVHEDGTRYVIEETHSLTTSHHLSVLRCAWREYEDPIPAYARRKAEEARERRNRQGRERRAAARRPVREMGGRTRRDDSALVAAVGPDYGTWPVSERPTRDQMLDPRYGDPNWTPWVSEGSNLPHGADARDARRVEQEQNAGRGWRP
jgi:hypothetical protein